MARLKVFSICSGVGGLDRPFHSSKNFEVVGLAEIDRYCIDVLRRHLPDVENYGDINEIEKHTLPDFDVLVGGTPCQSFSEAGKRKGFKRTFCYLGFHKWEMVKWKKDVPLMRATFIFKCKHCGKVKVIG